MKKVHFLIDKTKIVNYAITPVLFNKKKLKKRGYIVDFFYEIKEEFLECDILILVSKPILKMVQEKQAVIHEPSPMIDLIKKAREYTNKIIWMDTSDSTSVTHFELLPYIDLYLKKQLLKDKTLYIKKFYGGRIFTDYYHREFGVKDSNPFEQFYPLDLDLVQKVGLSWHIGLGDMYNAFNKRGKIRLLVPEWIKFDYKMKFTPPESNRRIDLFIRTTSNLHRELVAFHRKELIRRLNIILSKPGINGSTKGPWLSTKEFREALKNSKILPSPFGWGEIGVRDFEAFIFGAALLKPDLSHMETWPPIFIEHETYQPFKWNFEDLESVILELLENDKKRIEIARNGQESYRNSISLEGMEKFCSWFIQQIEK